MDLIRSRGWGVLLMVVATGPLFTLLVCLVLVASAIGGAAESAVDRARPIVASIQNDILPAVAKIRSDFVEIAGEGAALKAQVDGVVSKMQAIGDVTIPRASIVNWSGYTIRPPGDVNLHVDLDVPRSTLLSRRAEGAGPHASRAPPFLELAAFWNEAEDAVGGAVDKVAGAAGGAAGKAEDAAKDAVHKTIDSLEDLGNVTIPTGSLPSITIPGIVFPDQNLSLKAPGIGDALRSFSDSGAVGTALGAARDKIARTFDRADSLKDAVIAATVAATDVLRLIPYTIPLMLVTYVAIELALAAILLMCAGATLYVCLRRPREALAAFAISPLGFVFYCFRSVLLEAVTRLSGRQPYVPRAQVVAELRREIERLQADITARQLKKAEAAR